MECAGIYTLVSCSPWPAIPCGQKALPPMPGLQLVQAQVLLFLPSLHGGFAPLPGHVCPPCRAAL